MTWVLQGTKRAERVLAARYEYFKNFYRGNGTDNSLGLQKQQKTKTSERSEKKKTKWKQKNHQHQKSTDGKKKTDGPPCFGVLFIFIYAPGCPSQAWMHAHSPEGRKAFFFSFCRKKCGVFSVFRRCLLLISRRRRRVADAMHVRRICAYGDCRMHYGDKLGQKIRKKREMGWS